MSKIWQNWNDYTFSSQIGPCNTKIIRKKVLSHTNFRFPTVLCNVESSFFTSSEVAVYYETQFTTISNKLLKSKKLCLHHLDVPLVIPKSSKTKCFHKKCGFAAKYTLRDFSIISPLKNFQFWPNFFKHLHFFQVFKNLQFRPKFEKTSIFTKFSNIFNSKFWKIFKVLWNVQISSILSKIWIIKIKFDQNFKNLQFLTKFEKSSIFVKFSKIFNFYQN